MEEQQKISKNGMTDKKKIIGIVSPPYEIEATSMQTSKKEIERRIDHGIKGATITPEGKYMTAGGKFMERYGTTKGQIGNLKDNPKLIGITSPPFEESLMTKDVEFWNEISNKSKNWHGATRDANKYGNYGSSKGQIGLLKSKNNSEELDITQFHNCSEELEWNGCYDSDSQFKKFVTPESYSHPAKMSFLLADRIFKHLKFLGLLKKGDLICDFMAGTGRTNLMASLHGFDSIAVELEPHFIKIIHDNKQQLEKITGRKQNWEIIQGDSRKLTEILKIHDAVGIVSPPYYQSGGEPNLDDNTINQKNRISMRNNYGLDNPSNIGNLPDKNLVGITSPLFIEQHLDDKQRLFGSHNRKLLKDIGRGNEIAYGQNPENLGNQQGESYLSAMFQVYQQASQLMPIIVTVTKNPTRKGKLRRLDTDTAKLLMVCGYKIVDYHRAILFTKQKQLTLSQKIIEQSKGRISFFKRLSIQKGNVAAEWEDIIIAIKDG